jgi:hypothetical protein
MGSQYDLEVGFMVAEHISGDDIVRCNEIPAGIYGVLQYKGKNRGYKGNQALLEWVKNSNISWDKWKEPDGDHFRSRYEVYLSDIEEEADHRNWVKEVCIKTTLTIPTGIG